MNIIGFWKLGGIDIILVEKDSICYVVNKNKREVIFKGCENDASKVFVSIIAQLHMNAGLK